MKAYKFNGSFQKNTKQVATINIYFSEMTLYDNKLEKKVPGKSFNTRKP